MNVSSVNFAGSHTSGVKKKQSSPVKTGAKIGAGVGAALTAGGCLASKNLLKGIYEESAKVLGKNKTIATLVGGFAVGTALCAGLYSAIGAGVGAIVKAVKKDD